MEYMTAWRTVGEYGITERLVLKFCKEDKMKGAVRSAVWMIPKDAEKPMDRRAKVNK